MDASDAPAPLQARIDAYLARLPLTPAQAAALRARVAPLLRRHPQPSLEEVFAELHRALADGLTAPEAPGGPAAVSVEARLGLIGADAPRRGDAQLSQAFHRDRHGHLRLAPTPPVQRASMVPRPWNNNPLLLLRRWLEARFAARLSGPQSEAQPPPRDSPLGKPPWRHAGHRRRLLLIALILGQTYVATYFMMAILPYHGRHLLEMAILALYAVLFAWISAGFWTAMMGFWVLLTGRDRHAISGSAPPDVPLPETARTAILVPICNEDVERVFAGLRATYDSLSRADVREHFDFYILSDTSKADVRHAELNAWLQLCREVDGFSHIFYRLRRHRIKRKSGNVADWCRRWGSGYRYMVILDADSVMSGDCLKRLVQLMEANPGAGIIQTAPRAAGRETLYARIQQFATRVYGPLFTAGLHFWQLGESHYWGHNAILRVAPFMKHCALGSLPGKGALSGAIMSHDFVEAALMRRAGWAVWIAYDLPGSYEEMPPTLLDELKRDQRWCQGNLQNFRLFFTQGLHPAHRAVFMTGVMAYLSAPLWFVFLVLSTALLAVSVHVEPQYFTEPYQLFPNWPEWHPEWALRLFGTTMGLLFLPKILSAVLILFTRRDLKLHGGPGRLAGSLIGEMLFSAALAPVRMLFHTRYVVGALLGFSVQWKSPPREDASTPWSEALKRHGPGTVVGLAWAAYVYTIKAEFLAWLLPVAGSLVLAIPISVWSSRAGLGRWFRGRRLFLIPEESFPPRELRWLRAAVRRATGRLPGFREAVADPLPNALACAVCLARERQPLPARQAKLALQRKALLQGPEALDDAERNLLTSDPACLAELHLAVWSAEPAGAGRWGIVAAAAPAEGPLAA